MVEFAVFFLPLILLFVGSLVFWIWMIIDCAMNEPSEGNDKIIWILIIVLVQIIGALIYFFVRRPRRMELYGR
ncbi:MAG TPA: PLDc N-terminal domain-containing protein [bacterium]|nr:PLDc N-terminal domain-containing protein [bacterium]HQO37086.1 PLDc N-terminal domain-containing protein [bacterium]HQP98025.1 PLDc N-terminal domain-containing protein [bacterium]